MLLLLALIGLLGAAVMLLEFFPNLPGQGSSTLRRPPDAGRVTNP